MSGGGVHVDAADIAAASGGEAAAPLVWVGGVLGAVGLGTSLLFAGGDPARFYFSWLTAYLYFLSIALGGLFFVMTLFVTKAGWGVSLRRVAENVMATLPWFLLLFIPVWIGRHELYDWTRPEVVAKSAMLQGKSGYLNEGFFLVRAIFFLVVWSGFAVYFSTRSARQDTTRDEQITRRLSSISAPGLLIFSLTATFASVDWMMSLEAEWYSTMFGVYFFAGSVIGIFGFMVATLTALRARGVLKGVVTVEHLHDMGKLLFAFTVFWAYIAFSQYFLIWYADIPEETAYFHHRSHGGWPTVGMLLAFGHFAVPFFFLMPRIVKRSTGLLAAGAVWLLVMHYLDLYWCVMPVHDPEGPHPSVLDLAAFLAVGGIFLSAFGWTSSRRALVPLGDPRLAESLSFENV